MTDNAKIVEVAGLMLKLDQYKNEDDPTCLEDSARFEQAVKGLSQAEMMAVNMAYKLRQGKPYMVCSDNQEEIGGYKSLAEYMGATVEEVEEPVEATRSRNLQRCFNPHGPVPFGDASHVKIQRVGRPTNDQKSVCSRANNTLAEGEAARVPFIRGSGEAQ